MLEKRTLRKEIVLTGIGIHSGKNVLLRLKSSSSGKMAFRRLDLGNQEVDLDPRKIEVRSSTSLTKENLKIQTVEHLLAALYMFGIDSLVVELEGNEIPALDGSASPFVRAIRKAGIKPLPLKKKSIRILKPLTLEEKEASISFLPNSDFKISYTIEFSHPAIRRQELSLSLNQRNFAREIAPARTFGFLKDAEHLRSQGLALGGSLENAIVLDEEKVINGPLRFPDEFVRHKILDFIGDLALLGHPLLGHFKAYKAGHNLHLKAIHFLLDSPKSWVYE